MEGALAAAEAAAASAAAAYQAKSDSQLKDSSDRQLQMFLEYRRSREHVSRSVRLTAASVILFWTLITFPTFLDVCSGEGKGAGCFDWYPAVVATGFCLSAPPILLLMFQLDRRLRTSWAVLRFSWRNGAPKDPRRRSKDY